MSLTILQKLGELTVPQPVRAMLGWIECQLVLTTVVSSDRLVLRAIPDAEAIWPSYQGAYAQGAFDPVLPLTGR